MILQLDTYNKIDWRSSAVDLYHYFASGVVVVFDAVVVVGFTSALVFVWLVRSHALDRFVVVRRALRQRILDAFTVSTSHLLTVTCW